MKSEYAVGPEPTRSEVEMLAAAAVRLMSERGDVVLNAVDEGIYCLDDQGRTTFVNEAATRMLGYSLREMVGKPQHALIHHHYADGSAFPAEACPIWGSVSDGIHQRVGGDTFWRKDGTALPVDYTSIPIKEGRRVVAVVVTFRDTSAEQEARRQMERLAAERAARVEAERGQAALRVSEERFRALIAATGQIVWTNSPDGRMLGEQTGWGGFTGQSQREYEGFGWADALHPADRDPTIRAWNAAVASRGTFVFEHRVRRADGVYRDFAVRAIPLLEENGEIREWVGSHVDITDQRLIEAARDRALGDAQHARAELSRVFDQAPAAIATMEGAQHVFRTANPLMRQLLGNRDLVGRTVRDALPELHGQPFFGLLDEVYQTGVPYVGRQVPASVDRLGNGVPEVGYFDSVYQPLRDIDGTVNGIMVHTVEVSPVDEGEGVSGASHSP